MKGSNFIILKSGVLAFGEGFTESIVDIKVKDWLGRIDDIALILILAGSQTAEVHGISSAGASPASRRYTAVADAELLLKGGLGQRKWPLPPLPAGVSPALISYVAARFLEVKPTIISAGLLQTPPFSHVCFESPSMGPSRCLSSGNAMEVKRVKKLMKGGFEMGKKLRQPLLLSECVPGGTTTAFAVLSGLGINVEGLISGSARNPPSELKVKLVKQGLKAAKLTKNPSALDVMSAVGDPFQPIAVGLILGARKANQEILLGGGCQMLAVLAIALQGISPESRPDFIERITLGTTCWLVEESLQYSKKRNSFIHLTNLIAKHFKVNILGLASGYRFTNSQQKFLRDYEKGYIKEGVGAGALSLLAQIKGLSQKEMIKYCEEEVENLLS